MNTLVLKFGGASVAAPEYFSYIADLIIAKRQESPKVVVVVSAMGGTTDHLIQLANKVNPHPPQREYDMLISVGERISMSLLAMALCLKGHDAVSFTGSQSGIITCQQHGQAHIIDVRPQRIETTLDSGKIAIVAGFQGVSQDKEITTLGRGGSDTTAVALGIALNAKRVEFYKDVPGIFSDDPKKNLDAEYFSSLSYREALAIIEKGAKILHARAIRLAEKNGLPLLVRSFIPSLNSHSGTIVTQKGVMRSEHPVYESFSDEKVMHASTF